tara:strand:+ start:2160 stop:2852 length:693 start_codon:yes stop_codon:yes gene_type:complete
MKTKKVRSVGFDGLHRCGKGTQILLLKDYLQNKGVNSVIARGDGTRKGLGISQEDPYSAWWRDHYKSFFRDNRTPEENRYLSDLVYYRLTREAKSTMHRLERDSIGGVLLMDRTFVSRWFVKRQQEDYISLEDAVSVVDPDTHKKISPLIPERTYVIHVQLDELLKRIESSTDSPEKKQFRLDNLTKYFNDFERLIEELPETFHGNEIKVIDGNNSLENIHEKILGYGGI